MTGRAKDRDDNENMEGGKNEMKDGEKEWK